MDAGNEGPFISIDGGRAKSFGWNGSGSQVAASDTPQINGAANSRQHASGPRC